MKSVDFRGDEMRPHANSRASARQIRRAGIACALALATALSCRSQDGPQKSADLANQSLEDLMNIEVTSVSKKQEKLSRTAAAVFVITQEDIRRSGATNIPDLLRMVPGMDVGEINGSTWAIGARGFNQQFSNKLLVMVDGRVVYTQTFAGVFWDTMDLPLEDIDRIEVIRGPGAAIWGANAVDGVISIFTKPAASTKGSLVTAGTGTVQQANGLIQYGGGLGKRTDFRVYTKYFDQAGMVSLSGQNGADAWHTVRGGFRMDSAISSKDSLMVEGDLSDGREGEYGFVLPSVTSPGLVPVAEQIDNTDGWLVARWNHTYSARSNTELQVSYDRHVRDDPQNPEIRDTFNIQFQHHILLGSRHDIVWGLGYQDSPDKITGGLTVTMNPTKRNLQVVSSFIQDEIALVPDRVYVTLGSKFEHNDYTGFELMPTGRVAWMPAKNQTIWASVSRALRAPSRNDTNLVLNFGSLPGSPPTLLRLLGNPNYDDEGLIAYEAGYRATVSSHLSLDAAAYFNDYDSLQTTEPGTPFFENSPAPPHEVQPFTYENLMCGVTDGIEFTGNWQINSRFSLSPGYAFEQIHMHTKPTSQDKMTGPFIEGAVPRQSAEIRAHWQIEKRLSWDASAFFVDRLNDQGPLGNTVIPAYTRVDTGFTWTPREHFSLSFVGQNLEKDHHPEFQDINGALQNGQIKRSAYVKASWRF
jgi:iron complex outermembrane recepter protein